MGSRTVRHDIIMYYNKNIPMQLRGNHPFLHWCFLICHIQLFLMKILCTRYFRVSEGLFAFRERGRLQIAPTVRCENAVNCDITAPLSYAVGNYKCRARCSKYCSVSTLVGTLFCVRRILFLLFSTENTFFLFGFDFFAAE